MKEDYIRYKDFRKFMMSMIRDDAFLKECLNSFIKDYPIFRARNPFKCRRCSKYNNKLGYCKLYGKNVGVLDFCEE